MNGLGAGFLFLTVVAVPYFAVHTSRRMAAGTPLPPRPLFYSSTIAVQAFLAVTAVVAARSNGLALFPAPDFAARDVLAGAAALAIGLGTLPLRWRYRSEERKRRLYALVPRTGVERALWVAVSLAAGVGEEIAYRGALFGLLASLLGGWWPAALVSAAAFGLGHIVQGWRTAVIVFAIAVGFQGLVWLTGSLYTAMAVHFLYDLVTGIGVGVLGRDLEPEPARAG